MRAVLRSATLASWLNLTVQMFGGILLVPLLWSRWSPYEMSIYFAILSTNRFAWILCDRIGITFSTSLALGGPRREYLQTPDAPVDGQLPSGEGAGQVVAQRLPWAVVVFETLGFVLQRSSIIASVMALSILAAVLIGANGTNAEATLIGIASVLVAVGTLFLRFQYARYEILLKGFDRITELSYWNAAFGILAIIVNVAAVFLGGNLLTWSVVMAALAICTGLRNRWLTAMVFKLKAARFSAYHPEVISECWVPSRNGLVSTLAYVAGEELPTIVAPFYLDFREVPIFQLLNRLLLTVGPIAQIVITSRQPAFSQLLRSGNYLAVSAFACQRLAISSILAAVGAVMVYPVAILLAKSSFTEFASVITPAVWAFVASAYVLERLGSFIAAFLEAANTVPFTSQRLIATGATFILVPTLLYLVGPAGGFLAVTLPKLLALRLEVLAMASKMFRIPRRQLFVAAYLPAVSLLLCASGWLAAFGLG